MAKPILRHSSTNAANAKKSSQRVLTRLSVVDADRLEAFYAGLTFDELRIRFGHGMTSYSVRAHCNRLNWVQSVLFALEDELSVLLAVVELHPLSEGWESAEIVLAACAQRHIDRIFPKLVSAAVAHARARKCKHLFAADDPVSRNMLQLLRAEGRIAFDGESATVSLYRDWTPQRVLLGADLMPVN